MTQPIAMRAAPAAASGEHWEYAVQPFNSTLRLRFGTSPLDPHEVGKAAWLEIDPQALARIPLP